MKKILILGATGAMATYLIPNLLEKGMAVTGVSLDDVTSSNPNLHYIKGDATDLNFLKELLKEGYDGIYDFMIYFTKESFEKRYELFLNNTSHYIFFSTYRVYAGEFPIKEDSLRLLDADKPDDFVYPFEYSIYKAEQEDVLRNSKYNNFSIVRPAITFSQCRFQLVTLEANVLIYRMLHGKTVVLPEGAMDCEATMSWAGDVAKMLSGILLNPKAFRETYTVSTSEHHPWREIAKMYERIGGLKFVEIPNEEYIKILGDNHHIRQQLYYDRCYMRIVDNTKILDLCGLDQKDLIPLEEGLRFEFNNLTKERLARIGCNEEVNRRMDEYLAAMEEKKA